MVAPVHGVRDVRATHGRAEHTIPERGPPKGDGLAEVGVLALHLLSRPFGPRLAARSHAHMIRERKAIHTIPTHV